MDRGPGADAGGCGCVVGFCGACSAKINKPKEEMNNNFDEPMTKTIINRLAQVCCAALTLGVQAYAGQVGSIFSWGGMVLPLVQPGTRFTAVAAGGWYSLSLKPDGTVVAWGVDNYGQVDVPGGLSGVTALAAGPFHSLALKSDGTVVAWGYGFDGQTNVPAGLSGVVAISAGRTHSLALKLDETVVGWGADYQGQSTVPSGLSNVVAI